MPTIRRTPPGWITTSSPWAPSVPAGASRPRRPSASPTWPIPCRWTIGPLDSVTFYSDNTLIAPDEGRFDPIWQNVVGAMFAAGPVYTYIDIISAEDMIFMGGDMVGDSDASAGRNTRLNVNVGYYF